ncbi:phosphatase PAP2 family protein [Zoogloea sp.]|uniref:phosphatase PAP2 family protein n=1 Tax=Zoogloea sp. TaxID=49181 RepID=UPI0025EA15BA|nr:phosphatase PAP2 family protein [Zoogloea sp.]MCK6393385.1 phosphatase PAP2 family protein [Zoogloea sp.]
MEPHPLPLTESATLAVPGAADAPPRPLARIGARLRHWWWFKGLGTSLFMYVFFLAYLELLHHPLRPVFEMPLTWVDRQVGFQPWALVVYASLWVYVSLPAALAPGFKRLFSLGLHMACLCGAGLLCYVFWPTAVPPAAVDWGLYPGYALLKGIDPGGNACPSLHVAAALYSGLWLDRELREMQCGLAWHWGNWLWSGLIVFSTLATKQHVLLDVLAGSALAAAAAALSPGLWRSRSGGGRGGITV